MAFAPPVSRSNFHYNGNLFVEVGDFNRHERATVEEISAILRPDLRKTKKTTLDPPKDQVGHWYEAQLIHYGLPPSKDKARAKMRLLEALNSSKLVVPPNISKMEAEMKKEYTAAERKAKAQYKASMAPPTTKSEPAAAGKKRKQSDFPGNIHNINVNISLGKDFQGFPGAVDNTSSQPPAKKAKTGPSKPTNKNTEKSASAKPSEKSTKPEIKQQAPSRPRQTAKSAKLTEAWLKDPSIGQGPFNREGVPIPHPSSTKKEATAKKPAAKKEPIVKKAPAAKPEPKPKVEGPTRVKKEPGLAKDPKPKKEPKVKKEPSAKPSSQAIKLDPDAKPSPIPNPTPRLGLINGIYDLSCPTVQREWPSDAADLTLTLSLAGTAVWGAYDLGAFTGILFLPTRPYQATHSPLPFTWRGRETGEGEMSFGQDCDGEISFLGNGRIEGWIGVYGLCAFEGVRRVEGGTAVRAAGSMREEWEGYNEEAYEEERCGRWG